VGVGLVLAIVSALKVAMPLRLLQLFASQSHRKPRSCLASARSIITGRSSCSRWGWCCAGCCGWSERSRCAGGHPGDGAGSGGGCQAGLFVLQLPVLIGLGLLWLRGETPPARSGVAFAIALVATTLLVSLRRRRSGWGGSSCIT